MKPKTPILLGFVVAATVVFAAPALAAHDQHGRGHVDHDYSRSGHVDDGDSYRHPVGPTHGTRGHGYYDTGRYAAGYHHDGRSHWRHGDASASRSGWLGSWSNDSRHHRWGH